MSTAKRVLTTAILVMMLVPEAQAAAPVGDNCATAESVFKQSQSSSLKALSAYRVCLAQQYARQACRTEFAVLADDQARLETTVAKVAQRCGQ